MLSARVIWVAVPAQTEKEGNREGDLGIILAR